jgi:hypothetical protein
VEIPLAGRKFVVATMTSLRSVDQRIRFRGKDDRLIAPELRTTRSIHPEKKEGNLSILGLLSKRGVRFSRQ